MGMAALFQFSVAKMCDEIHRSKKLGKPHYDHKFSRGDLKRFKPYSYLRQTYRQDDSSSRHSHHSKSFRVKTATGKGILQETSIITLPQASSGLVFQDSIPEKF